MKVLILFPILVTVFACNASGDNPGQDLTDYDVSSATDEKNDVNPSCPTEFAGPNTACAGTATCEWGQECCCGKCYPSLVCTCQNGKWACYYTDACLLPPDVCPMDVDIPLSMSDPA